jgi:hypothetical protein
MNRGFTVYESNYDVTETTCRLTPDYKPGEMSRKLQRPCVLARVQQSEYDLKIEHLLGTVESGINILSWQTLIHVVVVHCTFGLCLQIVLFKCCTNHRESGVLTYSVCNYGVALMLDR